MITQKINYKTNLEKRITSDLKLLKDEEIFDRATYKNIKAVRSRPGSLYRLGMNCHLYVQFCQLLVHLPTN